MEKKRRKLLPSPAMIVAILALVVALAGTSFAALKLGKNAVRTKNIKNGAVTNPKIAEGAITAGKLAPGAITGATIAPSAKSSWVQTVQGGFTIDHESSGVTVAPVDTGKAVVDFGVDISGRAVSVTPVIGGLGAWTGASFRRCADVACDGGFGSNPRAIEVFTYDSANPTHLASEGFAAAATP